MAKEVKKYLVSDDCYSGQVVLVAETEDVEFKTLLNPEQVRFLYDEPLYETKIQKLYTVKGYYHYEEVENRDDNCMFEWSETDKDKANQLFLDALAYLR